MIDQMARKQMLGLIYNLAAKNAINFQLEDALPLLKRKKFFEVFTKGIWPFYGDFHKQLQENRKTAVERKALIARIVLFLHSDLAYRWPVIKKRFDLCFILAMVLLLFLLKMRFGYWIPMVVLLTIAWDKGKKRWWKWMAQKKAGNLAVWPFFTLQDYEHVSAYPSSLAEKD